MDNYLYHHGIKGQKWGVRRYQNEDGSLTPAGRERYYDSNGNFTKDRKLRREFYKENIKQYRKSLKNHTNSIYDKPVRDFMDKERKREDVEGRYKMETCLYHHGIKGQKWGVRRYQNEDGSLTPAGRERYSDEQYSRDKQVYGRIAANRIRRRVSKYGTTVSGERSREADRITRARKAASLSGKIGSTAGSITGGIGGMLAGAAVVRKLGIDNPLAQFAITTGASSVGSILGSKISRETLSSQSMIIRGYSPWKKRT